MSKTWINKGDYVVTRKGLADPFYGMVTKVCSDFYVRVLNHTTRQEHDYDACDFKIVKAAARRPTRPPSGTWTRSAGGGYGHRHR